MPREHKKLKVFQLCDELVLDIYKATKPFPKSETFGLTSQMRRAAVSVAANIVEGAACDSTKEFLYFLNIARGSLAELGYYIPLSQKLGYLNQSESENLELKHGHCIRALQGLINSFK